MRPAILDVPNMTLEGTDLDVISYSLYVHKPGVHKIGSKPPAAYIGGMVENAKLAKEFYPGWVVHCYLSDELLHVQPVLEDLGVQVTPYDNSPFWQGLFTRLIVMDDPRVRRFCQRDTDSRLGSLDQAAVAAWIKSGKKWHAMRGCKSHGVPLLGCAWGGPGQSFPNIRRAIAKWMKTDYVKGSDQRFTARLVWPEAQKSCLQHDAAFGNRFGKTYPFPKPATPYPYKFLFQTVAPYKESWEGLAVVGHGEKGKYV